MKQQNTLQPKLRFPEFEGDWIEKKYKEIIIENRLGGNYDNFDEISDFPLIKMGNIGRGNIILSKIQYLKCEENINNNDILRKGDLLFNTRNTLELVGKVAVWNNELDFALYNSNLMRMTFDNNIIESTNLFMNSLFNQLKTIKQLRSIATGTTSVAAIYNKDLNNIKFLFPSLPEQQRIADYLATIDNKINLLEEKKAQLALYKKAMMQKLFSQEIRFKPSEAEVLEAYPEWEEKRLGEVTLKTDKKNKDNLQLPVYSISNKRGFVPQSEQFDKLDSVERGFDIKLYKIVDTDTFAYNPARINVGSIGLYKGQEKVIVSSLYVCFKTFDKLLDKFLLVFLDTKSFNNQVLKIAEGGVRQYLFYENFAQIKIPLPSLPEQQKIAYFLSAIDESIEKVNEQISQTQSFKKAMLQQMFV